jgi:DNA polymerase-3 subunit alpha
MKEAGFVHLHNHTEFSLLDGASRIEQLAKQGAEYRMPALAITDHGNMFGVIEFYKKLRSKGVKPIIGCETYVAPHSRQDRKLDEDVPESSFHLTLLCETLEGYKNLVKLVSLASLEGFYYRPRIDKELLAKHAKGLIAMSACLKGEVNYYLNRDNYERAKQAALEYREILGRDNFFFEVMRLGLPETAKVETAAEKLGDELGIPRVATNDCHYLKQTDNEAHDALLCLQTGKRLKDKARLKFGTEEVYLKSAEEMARLFQDKPELIARSLEIASRCNVQLEAEGKSFHLPVFPRPAEYETDFAFLNQVAREGLARRFGTPRAEASARLEHELSVIARMGFAGYFLIVKDIVDYARSQGIRVGPGRGSAVGSLVLYALGITDVDPLRYGLIFERFLTVERVTLPDIDVDFADNRRAEVIAYVRKRYGEDCVAQIITFGTMQSRAAVRDVGRVLDVPLAEVDRLAKMIPFGAVLAKALHDSKELKALVASKPEYQKLFEIAARLEGISRHASIHASGVVITPRPSIELVPLYKTSDGDICTQYDMNALEAIGLLKMDVLGLRTLNVLDTALQLLKQEGIEIDLEQIPLDDPKTFDLLRRADIIGVFQLESPGMQNLLVRTQPENLEDIMAIISLYRPGPMGNVDLDEYIGRKQGRVTTKLMHPALDDVLKDTHGVIIYQEQVMKVANLVAGFSLAEADKLRRVMAKKVPELMGPMREKFVADAHKQHVSNKTANAIFDLIEPFAGYGFNKSHAAGYAVLSYQTAWLKANYPIEFMTATLTSEIGNADKLRKFVNEVRHMGLTLNGPDVNKSEYLFTIEQWSSGQVAKGSSESGEERQSSIVNRDSSLPSASDPRPPAPDGPPSPDPRPPTPDGPLTPAPRAIRYGLGGIKNLGQGVCEAIVKERGNKPYASVTDFVRRTREFTNRKAYESLVMAGALGSFNPDRTKLLEELPGELERASSARAAMLNRQSSLFGASFAANGDSEEPAPASSDSPSPRPPTPGPRALDRALLHTYEKNAFGFYFSSHPLEEFRLELEALKCLPLDGLADKGKDDVLRIAGVVTGRKIKKDKRGNEYAVMQLEDLAGSIEVMVFSDAFEQGRKLIKEDELLLVTGKMRSRSESQSSVWADSVMALPDCRNWLKRLTVRVKDEDELGENDLLKLRQILELHPGQAEVFFQTRADGKDKTIRVRDLKVQPSTRLVEEVSVLPMVRGARINGAIPTR